jgi:hypothetical protein
LISVAKNIFDFCMQFGYETINYITPNPCECFKMARTKSRSELPEIESPGNRPPMKAAAEAVSLPLAQQVAARIRDMIIQDQLSPGGWIREQALADKLRVSRTPLREALKMLELEGLIRLLPNRGALVTELTIEEVPGRQVGLSESHK